MVVERTLFIVAVITIPIMLFVKPFCLWLYSKRTSKQEGSRDQFLDGDNQIGYIETGSQVYNFLPKHVAYFIGLVVLVISPLSSVF